VHVDRFGNLITSIDEATFTAWAGTDAPRAAIDVAGQAMPVVTTYGDVLPGEAAGLFGSVGHLEVAVREGSAAMRVGVGRGAVVRLRLT
jgi:S-adenosylmethionine hydrolase